MILMSSKTHSRSLRTTVSAGVPSSHLAQRLSALIESAQQSDYLFGSPLGPFYDEARHHYLPHFVYFGPNSSQASLRLALLAGTGRHDLPAARALLAFLEGLVRQPDLGQGLNLSFFPLVNVLGLLGGAEERDLAGEHWGRSAAPEIDLLARDTRLRGYQGFVSVVTTADDVPSAWVRTVLNADVAASDVELFNSEDFAPWSVRFESVTAGIVTRGPLSIAEDLPFAPFEIELALPAAWPQAQADKVLAALLKRLIIRYRGFHAYGQHL